MEETRSCQLAKSPFSIKFFQNPATEPFWVRIDASTSNVGTSGDSKFNGAKADTRNCRLRKFLHRGTLMVEDEG